MIETTSPAAPAPALPEWCGAFEPDAGPGGPGPLTLDPGAETLSVRPGSGRSFQVVFSGYLYDREPLGRDLGLPHGAGDVSVAAAAYERWGPRVFDVLDGCYLLAIWDPAVGRLLIGHDALGRHPVFHTVRGGRFLFGANVLSLARRAHATSPNRESLALGALLFWPGQGETFFRDVHRLPPGHLLTVDRGLAVRTEQYWEPMPGDEEPWIADGEARERFEPELIGSVRRRLALEPQGIMLSGGVDSVTIAALSADDWRQAGQRPLVAVSARTGDELSAEERMQTAVAEALGMPHRISTTREWLAGDDRIEASLAIAGTLPAPSRIWWTGSYTRFYQRTAGEGLRVLLTGAGGDNWLGVADAHAADLIRRGALAELRRFVKADIVTGGASWASAARRLLWAGGVRPLLGSTWATVAPASKERFHRRRWRERLPDWLAPDASVRSALLGSLAARRTPDLTPDGRRPASYYRHSLRVLANPYLHHENETAFHVELACGLRLLSPYHDRRLVSFLNRIAPETLILGDRYKGLLRPVVTRRLPDLGLDRQRKDYPAHLEAARLAELRTSMAAAWRRRSLDRLTDLGIVSASRLAGTRSDWSTMSYEELATRFYLLCAEEWLAHRAS